MTKVKLNKTTDIPTLTNLQDPLPNLMPPLAWSLTHINQLDCSIGQTSR